MMEIWVLEWELKMGHSPITEQTGNWSHLTTGHCQATGLHLTNGHNLLSGHNLPVDHSLATGNTLTTCHNLATGHKCNNVMSGAYSIWDT